MRLGTLILQNGTVENSTNPRISLTRPIFGTRGGGNDFGSWFEELLNHCPFHTLETLMTNR